MLLVFLSLVIVIFFNSLSLAANSYQEKPGIDPTLRSGDNQEPLFKQDKENSTPPKIKRPFFEKKLKPQKTDTPIGHEIRVFVKKIETIGNKILSDEELSVVTAPYLNRELGYLDLEKIRRELTHFYIKLGYVNSGAILPDQTIANGTVIFRIVEGELTEISITGNRWLCNWYYESRIRLSYGPPVNIYLLEDQLQLLQQKDVVRRLQAEFKPGAKPGQSILDIRVEENSPFSASMVFNNYQSPSVGAERGLLSLSYKSVTGISDRFDMTYGRSKGLNPLLDFSYKIPFTPWGHGVSDTLSYE